MYNIILFFSSTEPTKFLSCKYCSLQNCTTEEANHLTTFCPYFNTEDYRNTLPERAQQQEILFKSDSGEKAKTLRKKQAKRVLISIEKK